MDRNKGPEELAQFWSSSLSARRAWIEIDPVTDKAWALESLSARRAWIEIGRTSTTAKRFPQSLSARRAWIEMSYFLDKSAQIFGRSPQGERG